MGNGILKRITKETAGRIVPPRRIFWCVRRRGARGVALTFDDGPTPEGTPRMLAALARVEVRATFFLVGAKALRYPQLVRDILAAGHEVGNHTHSHVGLADLSGAEIEREVLLADDALASAGAQPRLFRPPFGSLRWRSLPVLWSLGKTVAYWSVDSGDSKGPTPPSSPSILERVRPQRLTDGDVVLLHDHLEPTVQAVVEIVERARARGLGFATLGDWIFPRERSPLGTGAT